MTLYVEGCGDQRSNLYLNADDVFNTTEFWTSMAA